MTIQEMNDDDDDDVDDDDDDDDDNDADYDDDDEDDEHNEHDDDDEEDNDDDDDGCLINHISSDSSFSPTISISTFLPYCSGDGFTIGSPYCCLKIRASLIISLVYCRYASESVDN